MIDTHFPELTPYEDTISPIKEKSETKMVISNGVYFQGRLVDVQEDDAVRLSGERHDNISEVRKDGKS